MKIRFLNVMVAAITLAATAGLFAADTLFKGDIFQKGSAPTNGVNAVQTITIGGTPTGGNFTLSFQGKTTAPINWTATNATLVSRVDSALEALATIGTGGVVTANSTLSSGIGAMTATFSGGNLAHLAIGNMTASAANLTGTSPTVSISLTTAGVTADGRKSLPGSLLINTATGAIYSNSGTPLNPSWALSKNATE